eukprot:15224829-Alexandrium_andersonii.AAC.1
MALLRFILPGTSEPAQDAEHSRQGLSKFGVERTNIQKYGCSSFGHRARRKTLEASCSEHARTRG